MRCKVGSHQMADLVADSRRLASGRHMGAAAVVVGAVGMMTGGGASGIVAGIVGAVTWRLPAMLRSLFWP